MHEILGYIAAGMIFVSAIPYVIRTYQRKITPNVTTWSLWSFIGIVLFITYQGSGAQESLFAAICGIVNPIVITTVAMIRRNAWEKLTKTEIWCVALCVSAMVIWVIVRNDPRIIQWALYITLVADLFAAWPAIVGARKEPEKDRPFAWGLFALGSAVNILAVKEPTVANYAFPVYMTLGGGLIAWLLMSYRIKQKIPLREWI